jgi:four helix bundle protein
LTTLLTIAIDSGMYKPAKSFRDLLVWQKAHEFVLNLYKLSDRFPRHEQYCLIPQARRAAISIPANIAEGFKKRGIPDKNRFFNISQGSVEECRYYLILAEDLGYGQCTRLQPLLEDVSRLLIAYAQAVATNNSASALSRRKSGDSDALTFRHVTKEFRRRRKAGSSAINRQVR